MSKRFSLSRRRLLKGTAATFAAAPFLSATQALASPGSLSKKQKIPFGAAVKAELLGKDTRYTKAILQYCQRITPEGGMKWYDLRPTPTSWNFKLADRVAQFATQHGLALHGHTLVWHGAMPDWTKEIDTAKRAEAEMTKTIETVVNRYRDQVQSWDVVNEAISDNYGKSKYLRPGLWLETLGPDYIEQAFRTTAALAPKAQLVLNEYDIEGADRPSVLKRAALLKLLRHLKEKDVPLHAVGLQCHVRGHIPIDRDGLGRLCEEIKDMGMKVLVTELDVIDHQLPRHADERDRKIAEIVETLLDSISAHITPSSVTTWGITDRYTWVPMWFKRKDGTLNRPLPLDADYNPKPLMKVLQDFCSGKA